jgi:hypothetical protein
MARPVAPMAVGTKGAANPTRFHGYRATPTQRPLRATAVAVQLAGPCSRVARHTSRSERPVGGFEAQLSDEIGD